MTLPLLLRIVAWAMLIGLMVVTIGPIEWRPISPLPVQVERATALALIGFVFALAYPRHIILVSIVVLGATALFEVLQLAEPSRHGRVIDAMVKLIGGGAGLVAGRIVNKVGRRS